MKRITISLCILGFALTAKAQVGVNTTNPRGIFNVDGSQNNTNTTVPATVVAESKDDVVVEAGGNVGIGTSDPTVKLEIQTGGTATAPVAGVKIVDGTEGTGKTLTSDTNGNATWKESEITTVERNISAASYRTFLPIDHTYYYTNQSITLPPGKWMVWVSGYFGANNYSIHSFQDNKYLLLSTNASTEAFYNSEQSITVYAVEQEWIYIYGYIRISNTSTVATTYYLKASDDKPGHFFDFWPLHTGSMWAMKMSQ